jgi:hypothetical protein
MKLTFILYIFCIVVAFYDIKNYYCPKISKHAWMILAFTKHVLGASMTSSNF